MKISRDRFRRRYELEEEGICEPEGSSRNGTEEQREKMKK